jgi:hypothetical protein
MMKNVAVRLLFLLAAGSPFTGCGASVQPIDVMPGCPEMPLRGPDEYASAPAENMIDDFESGDLKLTPIAGRMGSWVGVSSGPNAQVFGEPSMRCVARGKYSGHLTSTAGPMANYPVNWNAVMIDPFMEAHGWDASAYSGFSFWIAAGVTAQPPIETPIGVTTTDTVMGGNVCNVLGGVCGDYYATQGRRLPLTRTWTRWSIKFDELTQYGFGVPQVAPLNKSKIVSIMIWPQAQFDIWIDDLRFEP